MVCWNLNVQLQGQRVKKINVTCKSSYFRSKRPLWLRAPEPLPPKKKQLRHWSRVTNEPDQRCHSLVTATASSGPGAPHYGGFTITLRHTTFVSTPLDEWSARRRDFYLTTHNTHKRQAFMPAAGFEPAIPANERSYTHALDRAVNVNDRSIVDYISRLRKLLWNVAYCRTKERERESEWESIII